MWHVPSCERCGIPVEKAEQVRVKRPMTKEPVKMVLCVFCLSLYADRKRRGDFWKEGKWKS